MQQTDWTILGSHGAELTPVLLTIPQVMRMTNLGRSLIYRKMQTGELESVKVDSKRLIPYEAVLQYLANLPRGYER